MESSKLGEYLNNISFVLESKYHNSFADERGGSIFSEDRIIDLIDVFGIRPKKIINELTRVLVEKNDRFTFEDFLTIYSFLLEEYEVVPDSNILIDWIKNPSKRKWSTDKIKLRFCANAVDFFVQQNLVFFDKEYIENFVDWTNIDIDNKLDKNDINTYLSLFKQSCRLLGKYQTIPYFKTWEEFFEIFDLFNEQKDFDGEEPLYAGLIRNGYTEYDIIKYLIEVTGLDPQIGLNMYMDSIIFRNKHHNSKYIEKTMKYLLLAENTLSVKFDVNIILKVFEFKNGLYTDHKLLKIAGKLIDIIYENGFVTDYDFDQFGSIVNWHSIKPKYWKNMPNFYNKKHYYSYFMYSAPKFFT